MNIWKANIKWGYVSQLLNSGINIILLPFVITFLTSEELGLWYAFVAVGSLVLLLDLGFSNIMVRNIGYAWNGVKTISKEKINFNSNANQSININLFSEIFHTGKMIYFYLALTSFVLLSTLGTLYIYKITDEGFTFNEAMVPWIIYILTVIINIYYLYWTPLLKGVGLIKEFYQINIISKSIQLILSLVFLVLGYSLTGICVAYLISILFSRILSKIFFYTKNGLFLSKNDIPINEKNVKDDTIKILLPSIYKQAILSFSNYLIDKFPIILSGLIFGLSITSQLGLTLQILSVFSTLGNVAYNTMLPEMIKSRAINDLSLAYSLLCKSLSIQSLIIIIGSLITILFGDMFLSLINSNTSILPVSSLILLSIYFLLFNFQLVCINYIIIGNEFPMLKSYVITGLSMIILSIISSYYSIGFRHEVDSIILSQLVVLISYSVWKWPLYIAQFHDINLKVFLKDCSLKTIKLSITK